MKKSELVKEVANKTNVSQANIKFILGAIQEVVYEHLSDKDGVPIIDGLKVTVVDRAARVARNPSTGENMNVPAKKVPKAKIGKALKEIALGL